MFNLDTNGGIGVQSKQIGRDANLGECVCPKFKESVDYLYASVEFPH